jgi:hypothetical protein
MDGRFPLLVIVLLIALVECRAEKPVEHKKPEPLVIVKPKPRLLTKEQRSELGFPSDVIAQIELAAGSEAEPFFVVDVVPSENLRGDKDMEQDRLAGFTVRTKKSDDIIASFRKQLRSKGYLIFKSHKGYGNLSDFVTVARGNNSYDILKIQGTEALNYQLGTREIIAWLRDQQKQGTFVIIGAGPDWLEARFINPPKDMVRFAKKVIVFAPDVLERGMRTAEELAEKMERINGFSLVWD